MKCLSEMILSFLCKFFANMLNLIMYVCYNDSKFGFLHVLTSLRMT